MTSLTRRDSFKAAAAMAAGAAGVSLPNPRRLPEVIAKLCYITTEGRRVTAYTKGRVLLHDGTHDEAVEAVQSHHIYRKIEEMTPVADEFKISSYNGELFFESTREFQAPVG